MIAWLLGKIGLGGVEKAVEGVAGIVTQHMKDNEAADELKRELAANAETVYANLIKAGVVSKNWFVADARATLTWVTAIAYGSYMLGRYPYATYHWISMPLDDGALPPYPIPHGELLTMVIVTGGFGGLHLANQLAQQIIGKR